MPAPKSKVDATLGYELCLPKWAIASRCGTTTNRGTAMCLRSRVINECDMRMWTEPGQDACTGWQAASGTRRDGKAPSHFEIAGDDRVFHPATAVIEGNELIVSSDTVAAPKAVRYAFTSGAMPNLMNREGLPASPFRTDTW